MNRMIDPRKFSKCANSMRTFFLERNYVEVHTQNLRSILAACEDPSTISTYQYSGEVWPLPQTGQMHLENVLLDNPDYEGAFCLSTSYRNEPNPVPGRHDLIFPMFEFESKGTVVDLQAMQVDLLDHLGFVKTDGSYPEGEYLDICNKYGADELDNDHELRLEQDYGSVFFLKNFPFYTSPFWNMKSDFTTKQSNKIDVILHGIETIGSAERSCDRDEMREMFYTISDGQYKDILYKEFTKERVDRELDEFLDRDFFPRYGGGIGVTRMIRAMEMSNLLD
uniref:Aminoacyl-tRNA synthetase class II (D/K/N) domain-containing protein n=1 Tax=viral metagenome TaxID=1070528 RepID=A0A6C0CG22_9ZZZZ